MYAYNFDDDTSREDLSIDFSLCWRNLATRIAVMVLNAIEPD
jgi:hypothetical protein